MENTNETNIPAENTSENISVSRWRNVRYKTILTSVIFGITFGFIGAALAFVCLVHIQNRSHSPFIQQLFRQSTNTEKRPSDVKDTFAEDSTVVTTVDKASPAVVSVVISQDVPKLQGFSGNPFNFPFFMMPQDRSQDSQNGNISGGDDTEKQTIGQGSGFLVSADGLIITNKHVVSSASAEYIVMTNDGKEYPAKVLARDPNRDIALLKIEIKDAPFLTLGNSDEIKVGQTVVAIGNSLGEFSNTVSKGIISGLKRNLIASSGRGGSEHLSNIIQTDAAINPGNSGGPLLDISGKVIGVNVAMAQGAQSIGFALPANQIQKIIDQVQATGKITTAFLGVRYIMLTPEIQKETTLPLDHGALILRGEKMTDFAVVPGSPADKAGLMENDIILEIDGAKINNDRQIADLVADHKPGDTMSLIIWHKGETKTVSIVLEEKK
jgi:serine protease Do